MRERVRVRGNPQRVADAVGLNPVTNQALFSVSSSGTLAYFAGAVGQVELVWLDRNGHELGRPGARGVISTIALSPDDTSVVYDQADPQNGDLRHLAARVRRRDPVQLTFNPSNDVFPVWSSDGKRIVFMSVRERPPQLYEMLPDAAGNEVRLFKARTRSCRPAGPGTERRSSTLLPIRRPQLATSGRYSLETMESTSDREHCEGRAVWHTLARRPLAGVRVE